MFEETKEPDVLVSENERKDYFAQYLDYAVSSSILEKTRVSLSQEPEPLIYLLRYVDGRCGRAVDFLHRGGIIMINGQKGCRKSTFARALLAILLNGKLEDCPPTITARLPLLKVAVIDTEQFAPRIYKHAKWLQKNYKGAVPFDERISFYSVRGYSPQEILALIAAICEETHPDVLFIDVFSNLVYDINSQEESKRAVDLIYKICEVYGVAVVGVMHQNPTRDKDKDPGDKMAGALGTQIERAASCVLNVTKVPAGVEIVEEKENGDLIGLGFGYNKSSIITFTALRDRYPDVPTMILTNENEKGDLALSIYPAALEKVGKGVSGDPKRDEWHRVPARCVSADFQHIYEREVQGKSPEVSFDDTPQEDGEKLAF